MPGNDLFSLLGTIVDAEMLNYCVRDGNRCDHIAKITRQISEN